jgi:hypothetical protein
MRSPLGIQLLRIPTTEWRELDRADIVSLARDSRHPRCQAPIEAIQIQSRILRKHSQYVVLLELLGQNNDL